MGLFNNILAKLGLKKEQPEAKPAPAAPAPKPAAPAPQPAVTAPKPPVAAAPARPAAKPPMPAAKPVSDTGTMEHMYAANAPKPKPVEAPMPAAAQPAAVQAAPAAIPMVDVVSKLEEMAKAAPEKLDWKVSIVDLLKLLGIDSSLKARKELAAELGCPAELMEDSAKMNTWLHKTVLQKIAENGGNIPQDLLD